MNPASRVATVDWVGVGAELDAHGWAKLDALFSREECAEATALYEDVGRFRSHVLMERHGFGRGEYKYFSYPLPEWICGLRTAVYPPLSKLANRWNAMALASSYPETHAEFLERCHAAGQERPTPLLLRYGPGDYNCLHQDLYGPLAFPLQLTVLLSDPARDFSGGEFVLTEQRPRMQSRAEVVPLGLGDAVIFAVDARPVAGRRGTYRVKLRHGVSRVRSGRRHALGVIFHDAA